MGLPSEMKALRYSKPEEYGIVTVPLPKVRDNDVLIKVKACGVCGTEFVDFSNEQSAGTHFGTAYTFMKENSLQSSLSFLVTKLLERLQLLEKMSRVSKLESELLQITRSSATSASTAEEDNCYYARNSKLTV